MSEKQQRERAGKFYAPGFSKLSTWSVFGRLEDPFERRQSVNKSFKF